MIYTVTKQEMHGLTGEQFEDLVAQFYEITGNRVAKTAKTNDYGADLIVETNMIGKMVVQCKRQTATVGIKAVQEVHASKSKYNASSAFVISSVGYSANAIELAKACGVELIDGNMFFDDYVLKIQNDEFMINEKESFRAELNKLAERRAEYDEVHESMLDSIAEIDEIVTKKVEEKTLEPILKLRQLISEFSLDTNSELVKEIDTLQSDLTAFYAHSSVLEKEVKDLRNFVNGFLVASVIVAAVVLVSSIVGWFI